MKATIIVRISFSSYMLFFITAGCEKNDNTELEVAIGDSAKCIENVAESIEFNFCLLDENGVESTSFDEGENFIFDFSF